MASSIAPNIVTNGLAVYLDAFNSKSYPGTGTVWSDLGRSQQPAELFNGAVFDATRDFAILFDGIDDYVITGYSSNPEYFTFECTFQLISNSGTTVVVGKNNGAGDDYWMGINGGNLVFSTNGSILDSNIAPEEELVTVTCVISNTAKEIYINGVLANSTATTSVNPNGPIALATFGTALGYFTNCRIYFFKFYERALSSTEIAQNYNELNSRFT